MEHTPLLTWRARTRPKHERTKLWYLLTGSFATAIAIYGIQTRSIGLVVLTIMGVFVYYIFALRPEPTTKTITITDGGVQLDFEFFPWKTLTGFWFQRYPDYMQLHIEHIENWRYDLIIQTGPVSIVSIRPSLLEHIPEHADRVERILDKISRLCKI